MQPKFNEINEKESPEPPPYGWNGNYKSETQASDQGSAAPMPILPNPTSFPKTNQSPFSNTNPTSFSNTNPEPVYNTNPNTSTANSKTQIINI